jgi:hypothetical protein
LKRYFLPRNAVVFPILASSQIVGNTDTGPKRDLAQITPEKSALRQHSGSTFLPNIHGCWRVYKDLEVVPGSTLLPYGFI